MPGGHRRGGVYSQRDVGLAGQPGAYCSADRLRYRLPWGRGDYARWYERPRPQYRRHAVVFGRDRRTLRPGQFWNATAATLIILCANILLREAAQRIHALPGAGDEEKRYVLRVTCLREHENAVRQLLLNIAQQQRFTLQGLQSAAADTADHLEICAQLISHKQHQKRWRKLWRKWAFSRTSHRCTGVSERRRGWRRSSGNGRSSRDSPSRGKAARMASSQEVIRMLNNGCVPSESGPTEVTADFRFTRVMAEQAARARLTLDDDQLSLIARLDALGQQLVSTTGRPQGVYVWGRTGRGKSFILDHFFASLPLAAAAGPFSSLLPRTAPAAECPRSARPADGDEADDIRLPPAMLRRISSARPRRRHAD